MNIELTIKESKLVSDLMEAYDQSTCDHEMRCQCDWCKAIEAVGNCHVDTWNSLQEKTNQPKP